MQIEGEGADALKKRGNGRAHSILVSEDDP